MPTSPPSTPTASPGLLPPTGFPTPFTSSPTAHTASAWHRGAATQRTGRGSRRPGSRNRARPERPHKRRRERRDPYLLRRLCGRHGSNRARRGGVARSTGDRPHRLELIRQLGAWLATEAGFDAEPRTVE